MSKEEDTSMGLKFSEDKVASCEMREESRWRAEFPCFVRHGQGVQI